nr:hydroquinone glucosyltransferase [Quercus suber]
MFLPSENGLRLAEGIILNTFMDLEESAVKASLEEEAKNLSLYPIGPIIRTGSNSSNQVEGSVCLRWLDNQPHGSVLFVCFGSAGTLSYEQINELALGLELKGFVERTKGQGLVVPFWAPQVQVLSHISMGGFLTHCGWNSILKSIMHGIPLITWPLFAKQRLNAVLLDEDLKVALRPKANEKGLVDREEIAIVIKGLMVGVEGKKVKSHMKGLKIAAEKALSADGSSTKALAEFASYCTNQPGF